MASVLKFYIDFKSPYAYLAIEPTRRLARELDIEIDWLPFVLDIPSYLGSARLKKSGEVAEHSRSDEQWSGVKYAYYDCRRYANLRGLTIRGTVKIWDTNLAAIGMLWAKAQGDQVLQDYIDGIYVPFWRRELDVEDIAVIENVLAESGAYVPGFRVFALDVGAGQNNKLQQQAFDSGIFGVPAYVLGEELYFGREHLPRIRWQLQGQQGSAPDIAYDLLPDDVIEDSSVSTLEVGISLGDPESHTTIQQVLSLARDLHVGIIWYELPAGKSGKQTDLEDQSRGARHRRFRSDNREQDARRYKPITIANGDVVSQTRQLLREHDIELRAEGLAGISYLNSPVFRLGQETYIGRQHLPLIRAQLKNANA
ncbi:MAG: 2-hydroxychromene-2-carboxylate isomerase [Halioglobus sp.]|jgi:2-hydroxychromene-2-carboxylate isomerase